MKNINKRFENTSALDNISLEVKEGEIYGLLGPNGAGKSTLINILSSLVRKSHGDIEIFNKNLEKNLSYIKTNIGIVPQDIAIYEDLTAYENVKFFGSLYGLSGDKLKENVEDALRFVGLDHKKKEYPHTFSGGMKRRLTIACAIVHKPKLIIMDEPTVGIDPQSRSHILDSVKKLNKMGSTIIYTTHYMEEVEHICTRIGIIDKGNLIAEGTSEDLKKLIVNRECLTLKISNLETFNIDKLKGIGNIIEVEIKENNLIVYSTKDSNNLNNIISHLSKEKHSIQYIRSEKPDLEKVFLTLTGRKLRD